MADGQAKPHAVRLGADESLEQPLRHVRRKAGATVLDRDLNEAIARRSGRNAQSPHRTVLHGLDRVANEVEYHLLDRDAIDQDAVDRRIELDLPRDPTLAHANHSQRARLVHDALEALDPPLALAPRDKVAQPPDDLAGAHRLLRAILHRLADDRQGLLVRIFEELLGCLDIIGDGRQRLVQFVGDGSGERAHRRHARDMRQCLLEVV